MKNRKFADYVEIYVEEVARQRPPTQPFMRPRKNAVLIDAENGVIIQLRNLRLEKSSNLGSALTNRIKDWL